MLWFLAISNPQAKPIKNGEITFQGSKWEIEKMSADSITPILTPR